MKRGDVWLVSIVTLVVLIVFVGFIYLLDQYSAAHTPSLSYSQELKDSLAGKLNGELLALASSDMNTHSGNTTYIILGVKSPRASCGIVTVRCLGAKAGTLCGDILPGKLVTSPGIPWFTLKHEEVAISSFDIAADTLVVEHLEGQLPDMAPDTYVLEVDLLTPTLDHGCGYAPYPNLGTTGQPTDGKWRIAASKKLNMMVD